MTTSMDEVYVPLILSVYNRYSANSSVFSGCIKPEQNLGIYGAEGICRELYWGFGLTMSTCTLFQILDLVQKVLRHTFWWLVDLLGICLALIHFSIAIRTFVRAKRQREGEDRAIEAMLDTDTALDDDLLEDVWQTSRIVSLVEEYWHRHTHTHTEWRRMNRKLCLSCKKRLYKISSFLVWCLMNCIQLIWDHPLPEVFTQQFCFDYLGFVAGMNLSEIELTQWRSSVGVGKPSPLNKWPRCPPHFLQVISILSIP